MVRLVTVAADATDATTGVIAQDITIVPGMAPPPMPTLTQPAFANWHAAPISPGMPGGPMGGVASMVAGYGVPSPTVQQPRDSGWRMDQRALGERRAQQEHQRAYLKAQIEEKRQRDEARRREVKEREARKKERHIFAVSASGLMVASKAHGEVGAVSGVFAGWQSGWDGLMHIVGDF